MLIIFDVDGTLYRTETATVPAVKKALGELHLPVPHDERIQALIGAPSEVFCQQLLGDAENALIAEFQEKLRRYERAHIPTHAELYEGIPEVLEQLSREHRLVICSNASQDYIERVLETCRIAPYFASIHSCRHKASKAEIISEICADASECVVIGDTHYDFQAAGLNHIPSIGMRHGYGYADVEPATFFAEKSTDILSLVDRLAVCMSIEKHIAATHPKVIGINGVDTSGKTEFTVFLSKYLRARHFDVTVIHLDDFHHPSSVRRQGKNEIDAYINNAFNLELLGRKILRPAYQRKAVSVSLDLLDLETDEFTNTRRYDIAENALVLLEGTLLYRPPISQYIDARIFLQIPFDEVLKRAEVRDVPKYGVSFLEKYRQKYIPIQQWYLDTYQPVEQSDFVIDNTDYRYPKIMRVVA
jgi:phosphoglycolate phosphatase